MSRYEMLKNLNAFHRASILRECIYIVLAYTQSKAYDKRELLKLKLREILNREL